MFQLEKLHAHVSSSSRDFHFNLFTHNNIISIFKSFTKGINSKSQISKKGSRSRKLAEHN